jgi:hypothetical protein
VLSENVSHEFHNVANFETLSTPSIGGPGGRRAVKQDWSERATERAGRCQLREGIGRDPLDATAVSAPRPERLAGSQPAFHVRAVAPIAEDRTREVGRSTARPRDRAAIRAEAALLSGRFRRNLEREAAAAVETADVPDIVELLQRLDRVRFVTGGAAGNSPGACGDFHVGL